MAAGYPEAAPMLDLIAFAFGIDSKCNSALLTMNS